MKKSSFLLVISYALLVSCGNAVSLAQNFEEDENYYDPTLPSPEFARTALTLPEVYSENQLDEIWTDSTKVVAPQHSKSGGFWWRNNSGWSNTGMNAAYGNQRFSPFASGSSFAYSYSPWNSPSWMWNDNWGGVNGYGYGYYPWMFNSNPWGYHNGYHPNTFGNNNGWNSGWNNGSWASNSNGSTAGTLFNGTRLRINYGGKKPSRYSSSRATGSSSGRVSNGGYNSGNNALWRGAMSRANTGPGTTTSRTTTSSAGPGNTRGNNSGSVSTSSRRNYNGSNTRSSSINRSRSYNNTNGRGYSNPNSSSPSSTTRSAGSSSTNSSGRRR